MNGKLRKMLNWAKPGLWLFIAGFLLAGFLSTDAQEITQEPSMEKDKITLEIESILGEELKQLNTEWVSLFTEENVNLIKANIRKTLPKDADEMSEGSRKALIRKAIRDTIYNSMKSVVMKGAQTLLLEQIDKLPPVWRALALRDENISAIVKQIMMALTDDIVNLPKEKRQDTMQKIVFSKTGDFKNSIIIKDIGEILAERFNAWPEKWKDMVTETEKKKIMLQILQTLIKKNLVDASDKERSAFFRQEALTALYQLSKKLVGEDVKLIVSYESTFMSDPVRRKIIFDEKVVFALMGEMTDALFQSISKASIEDKPLLLFKASAEKLQSIAQKVLKRESTKLTDTCLKENLSEDAVFGKEKFLLLLPVSETITKEQETFPYVDETYYQCKAASENDLSYCAKITGEGTEGHKEDCETFVSVYTKVLPEIIKGNYPSDVIGRILSLKTSPAATQDVKDAFSQLLKACAEKSAASCETLKGKNDFFYRVCQSALKRDVKECSSAEFVNACVQSAYMLEALLYNDDAKIKKVSYEDISIPFALLGKLYFNKNTCAEYYEEVIKKRYCHNLYMYKQSKEIKKEVKKDEKEKEK